jgi:hypothetical protein
MIRIRLPAFDWPAYGVFGAPASWYSEFWVKFPVGYIDNYPIEEGGDDEPHVLRAGLGRHLGGPGLLAVFEAFPTGVSAAPKSTDPLVVKACLRASGNVRVTMTWHDLPGGVGNLAGVASYYAGGKTAPLGNTQWRYQISPYPLSGQQVMEFMPPPNVPSPNDGSVNQVSWAFALSDFTQFNENITDFGKC